MSASNQPPANDGYRVLALMLWRERWLMIATFLIVALAGLILVMQLEKSYTAKASLLVRYDDAYVYQPLLGDGGRGESFNLEQIIQSEIGLLRADQLKTRVLNEIGLREIYPELANEYAEASPSERREIFGAAIRTVRANLGAGAAPNTSIIDVSFTHDDPQVAAEFLNTLIQEYLQYRRDVLLGEIESDADTPRDLYESRLEEANNELEVFLSDSGLGDFEGARQALRDREARVANDLLQAEADLAQWRARLSSINGDLTGVPQEIEQYVENDATGRLLELEMERQDLLTRYKPDATPVREVEQQIEGFRRFLASGGGEGAGMRRVGPNPIRQALESDSLEAEAQVRALAQRVTALNGQLRDIRDEQLRLQNLAPEYERRARRVRAIQTTLDQVAERQEQTRALRDLTADAADNVRIVETAEAPTQGHSIKKVAFAGVLLVAGFLALVAGLLHAFLTPPPGAAPARRKRRDNRGSHREDVTHVHHYEAPPKERLPVLAMVRRNPA
ncbi:MAG: hypothetical protein H2040_05310 [Euryhalocaulis sp.]|uniref:GumC family protein n=1 Tax=Euryhalocaulis sp. TaxID=2744307 RepID=UPI0017B6A38D|nr:Wzz/FepE/Etk N-terminal domain-containing protein [Euryhalocaulis sp.]MBA4801261.1 hypothetical protein [Euryhalocaulis sp.]